MHCGRMTPECLIAGDAGPAQPPRRPAAEDAAANERAVAAIGQRRRTAWAGQVVGQPSLAMTIIEAMDADEPLPLSPSLMAAQSASSAAATPTEPVAACGPCASAESWLPPLACIRASCNKESCSSSSQAGLSEGLHCNVLVTHAT